MPTSTRERIPVTEIKIADEPLDNPHRNNTEPHWRLYINRDGAPVAVCVTANDYPGYDAVRFLTEDAYETDNDALLALNRKLTHKATYADPMDRTVAAQLAWAGAPLTREQCLLVRLGGAR
jgi:hypothetical protein